MSRKNVTVAGLLTAAFTVVLLTFLLRPSEEAKLKQAAIPAVPNPAQEKTVKKPHSCRMSALPII